MADEIPRFEVEDEYSEYLSKQPDGGWTPYKFAAELLAQHDSLFSAVKEEVEHYRESAAAHRDEAMRRKDARDGEEQIRRGLEDDTRADRLQAILDQAGEGKA